MVLSFLSFCLPRVYPRVCTSNRHTRKRKTLALFRTSAGSTRAHSISRFTACKVVRTHEEVCMCVCVMGSRKKRNGTGTGKRPGELSSGSLARAKRPTFSQLSSSRSESEALSPRSRGWTKTTNPFFRPTKRDNEMRSPSVRPWLESSFVCEKMSRAKRENATKLCSPQTMLRPTTVIAWEGCGLWGGRG